MNVRPLNQTRKLIYRYSTPGCVHFLPTLSVTTTATQKVSSYSTSNIVRRDTTPSDAPLNIHGDWESSVTSKAMKKKLVSRAELSYFESTKNSTRVDMQARKNQVVPDAGVDAVVPVAASSHVAAVPHPPPPPPKQPMMVPQGPSPMVAYLVLGVGFGLAMGVVGAILR